MLLKINIFDSFNAWLKARRKERISSQVAKTDELTLPNTHKSLE